MVVIESRARMRREDLAALPENGSRYELLEGELLVSPAPGRRHQFAVASLLMSLTLWARQRGGLSVLPAPLDVVFDDETVLQPDLVMVTADDADGPVTSVPLLCVEVLSPTTRTRDMGVKRDAYARRGVPRYWVVDPEARAVRGWLLEGTNWVVEAEAGPGGTFAPPGMPGFELDVDSLFA